MTTRLDQAAAQRLAVGAALLDDPKLPASEDGVVAVARHFGAIQIDPTRTVERTQYLVLWSRLGNSQRSHLERAVADRPLVEWNAFIVPSSGCRSFSTSSWPRTSSSAESILNQLRDREPLPSRELDDSKVKIGWQSTGWTHGKNTT